MKQHLYLWFIPLLLTQSFGQEVDFLPRKNNMVSKYLSKVLDSLIDHLNTSKVSIPEINLGEETGKLSEVEISVPGEMKKFVDGVASYGFKLETNVTEVFITGNYDILYLDVPGLFPFFGKGKFNVTLDVITLNMKLTANYDAMDEKFNIDIPDFVILVQNSTVEFENLMNDPHLADFLNELLSKLLPDVIQIISKPLMEIAKPLIDYYGNGIIKCIKEGILLGNVEQCIRDLFYENPAAIMGEKPNLIMDLSKYFNFHQLNL